MNRLLVIMRSLFDKVRSNKARWTIFTVSLVAAIALTIFVFKHGHYPGCGLILIGFLLLGSSVLIATAKKMSRPGFLLIVIGLVLVGIHPFDIVKGVFVDLKVSQEKMLASSLSMKLATAVLRGDHLEVSTIVEDINSALSGLDSAIPENKRIEVRKDLQASLKSAALSASEISQTLAESPNPSPERIDKYRNTINALETGIENSATMARSEKTEALASLQGSFDALQIVATAGQKEQLANSSASIDDQFKEMARSIGPESHEGGTSSDRPRISFDSSASDPDETDRTETIAAITKIIADSDLKEATAIEISKPIVDIIEHGAPNQKSAVEEELIGPVNEAGEGSLEEVKANIEAMNESETTIPPPSDQSISANDQIVISQINELLKQAVSESLTTGQRILLRGKLQKARSRRLPEIDEISERTRLNTKIVETLNDVIPKTEETVALYESRRVIVCYGSKIQRGAALLIQTKLNESGDWYCAGTEEVDRGIPESGEIRYFKRNLKEWKNAKKLKAILDGFKRIDTDITSKIGRLKSIYREPRSKSKYMEKEGRYEIWLAPTR